MVQESVDKKFDRGVEARVSNSPEAVHVADLICTMATRQHNTASSPAILQSQKVHTVSITQSLYIVSAAT